MKHLTQMVTSSNSDEAYTPEWILNYARKVICKPYDQESFDLDPFSDPGNNTKAQRFITKDECGFATPWKIKHGSVWINPPFSEMKRVVPLVQKYCRENLYLRTIMLAKADFRTKWSKELLKEVDGMIVVNDYVKFEGSENSAPFSVVLY